MQLLLRVLIGMALLGGGVASGSVSVQVVNHADGLSTVTVPSTGGTVTVDVKVTATGEGTGISGVQFDLAATGGAGTLDLASGSYGTAAGWDADVATGTALAIPTGAVKPGPVGPTGAGLASGGVLPNGTASVVATLTLNVSAGAGTYLVNASGLAFPDFSGSTADIALTPGTALSVNVQAAGATIVNRALFYAGSGIYTSYGVNPIAPDKVAKRPGTGTATFANVSSYSRGLNGIIVDIDGASNPTAINASDFTFKYGNTTTPANWTNTPVPTSVTSTLLSGTTYRVRIFFANNAIPTRNWLKVTTLNNALHIGPLNPAADDVFYFGLCIGECGLNNTASAIYVSSYDYGAAYTNRVVFPAHVANGLNNLYDFNRDSYANSTDYGLSYTERGDPVTKKLAVINP